MNKPALIRRLKAIVHELQEDEPEPEILDVLADLIQQIEREIDLD